MQKIVKTDKTAQQAFSSLMNLCAKSEKSSGDARRLMARWGVESAEREGVLKMLIDQKFIDDSRYAAAFMREKLNLSGWGAYKIRATLAAKGVSREIIDSTLALVDKDKMDSRLEVMLVRKQRMLNKVQGYELRAKLMRYGLSLGYDYDNVTSMVDKITRDLKDDDF